MKNFIRDESGLQTLERAILAGLILSGLVAIIMAIRTYVIRDGFGNLLKETRATVTK
jgi:Flp pilus assembly pilin Flp